MGTVTPFRRKPDHTVQVCFNRAEIGRIVDLYGRMVSAGLWKDYAIEFRNDAASFWAFRRTAERPEYRIEKRPSAPQGTWSLIGESGAVLRRGDELSAVLAPIERRLLKLVGS